MIAMGQCENVDPAGHEHGLRATGEEGVFNYAMIERVFDQEAVGRCEYTDPAGDEQLQGL